MAVRPVEGGASHNKALRLAADQPLQTIDKYLLEKDPVWWAETNLRTDKGEPLDFVDHPYLELIYEDWHPNQVYKKAAQVGMTQTNAGKIVYFCVQNPVNVIYTFPTGTAVEEFAGSRFDGIVSAWPERAQYLGKNNVGYKEIGQSKIYFRGTFNETQGISVPSDFNCHDEVNFSKDDILDIYPARLSVSKWKIEWLFSTPTIPDFGISAAIKKTDQRHWFVRCTGCGRRQRIRWYGEKSNLREVKKWGRHIRWYFGCTRCDKELDRREGIWVVKYPSKSHVSHGYHIPQQIVPIISADDMKKEETKAEEKGRIKNFYNFNLGEDYAVGATLITKTLIASRSKVFTDAYLTEHWYIGVDQGDTLHWELCRLYNSIRLVVAFGTCKDFDYIAYLMDEYKIRCGVIDAQPNKHSAKALRDKFPGRLFLCYYRSNQPHQMKAANDDEDILGTKNEEKYAINVDHTESLDSSAQEWVNGKVMLNADPRLFENSKSRESIYAEQMANLKRDTEEDKHGNMKGVWKKTGADHYRHADNYAMLAVEIMGKDGNYEFETGGKVQQVPFEDGEWTETEQGLVVPKKGGFMSNG